MKKLLLCFLLVSSLAFADSTLTGRVTVSVEHKQSIIGALGTPRDQATVNFTQAFAAGSATDAAEINTLYYAQRILGSGSSENLDLHGSLVNNLGETVNFSAVKGLYLKNRTETQTMTVGNGSNPWGGWISPSTGTIDIPPMGSRTFTNPYQGWTVTSGTADILKISNDTGASLTYDIWVIGLN